jgi:hypothetical protein
MQENVHNIYFEENRKNGENVGKKVIATLTPCVTWLPLRFPTG